MPFGSHTNRRLLPLKLFPVPETIAKKIRKYVRSSQDRIFVRVAANSQEMVLTSHDFKDIPVKSRQELKKKIAVKVLDASESLKVL